MTTVNMHEAKTNLSKLVQSLVSGEEKEIVIARNGQPMAMLVPLPKKRPVRLGLAKGKYKFDYEAFRALDDEVAKLFEDSADPWGEKLSR